MGHKVLAAIAFLWRLLGLQIMVLPGRVDRTDVSASVFRKQLFFSPPFFFRSLRASAQGSRQNVGCSVVLTARVSGHELLASLLFVHAYCLAAWVPVRHCSTRDYDELCWRTEQDLPDGRVANAQIRILSGWSVQCLDVCKLPCVSLADAPATSQRPCLLLRPRVFLRSFLPRSLI